MTVVKKKIFSETKSTFMYTNIVFGNQNCSTNVTKCAFVSQNELASVVQPIAQLKEEIEVISVIR